MFIDPVSLTIAASSLVIGALNAVVPEALSCLRWQKNSAKESSSQSDRETLLIKGGGAEESEVHCCWWSWSSKKVTEIDAKYRDIDGTYNIVAVTNKTHGFANAQTGAAQQTPAPVVPQPGQAPLPVPSAAPTPQAAFIGSDPALSGIDATKLPLPPTQTAFNRHVEITRSETGKGFTIKISNSDNESVTSKPVADPGDLHRATANLAGADGIEHHAD